MSKEDKEYNEIRKREKLMDGGGPAFPSSRIAVGNSTTGISQASAYGMSLRDGFAGKAMQSILYSALTDCTVAEVLMEKITREGSSSKKIISEKAFSMADAMLEERGKI